MIQVYIGSIDTSGIQYTEMSETRELAPVYFTMSADNIPTFLQTYLSA